MGLFPFYSRARVRVKALTQETRVSEGRGGNKKTRKGIYTIISGIMDNVYNIRGSWPTSAGGAAAQQRLRRYGGVQVEHISLTPRVESTWLFQLA